MSEVENNPIEDLVQAALDQNFNKANEVFADMMTAKVTDALDQEKIGIANSIYNGVEPEEDDYITDDEIDQQDDTDMELDDETEAEINDIVDEISDDVEN